MSMSEFEREAYGSDDDLTSLSNAPQEIPDDFSSDDVVFAHELDTLFNAEREDIPPLFVQTLLAPHDPRFQIAEEGFEKKTSARVFRRLHLHRRLFRSSFSFRQILTFLVPARRSLTVVVSVLFLVLLSMVYTAPSFASGLSILLAGSHGGVMQVRDYPGGLAAATNAQEEGQNLAVPSHHKMNILDAQQLLHFPLYWPRPNALPDNYVLDTIYLYNQVNQTWADGPVVELDYDYTSPGTTPHGTGHIAICEFKPAGKVLQVVQLGAAHKLKIDSNGNASAIYVNGQWTALNNSTHVWDSSGRSELIYEKNGIIFWIVGSQSDGVDGTTLSKIAASLDNFEASNAMRLGRAFYNVMQSQDSAPGPLTGDVIYLDNPDNPDGPTLLVVGGDASGSSGRASSFGRYVHGHVHP